jgi:ATP-dependent Zn protease
LHPRLLSAFSEQITLLPPSPPQRQRIIDSLLQENQMSTNQLQSIRAYADSLSSLPLLSFLHHIRSMLSGSVLPSSSSSVTEDLLETGFIGSEEVKRVVMESILWPRQHPQLFCAYQLSSETGILLYGPPGTGKTFFPQYIAQKLGYTLINIRFTEIIRGEIGSGEHRLRELFQQAKHLAPAILFIDEFQAIFASAEDHGTDSLSAALSSCLDDINVWNEHAAGSISPVILIAATNEPWAIDASFLRPGRFDRHLFIGPFSIADRVAYIRSQLQTYTRLVALDKDEIDELIVDIAEASDGFTAADMKYFFKRFSRELVSISSSYDDNGSSVQDRLQSFIAAELERSNHSDHKQRQKLLDRYSSWSIASSTCR